MAAKFVLKKTDSGQFHFNLLATNGRVIATSEFYKTKAAALAASNRSRRTHLSRAPTTRPVDRLASWRRVWSGEEFPSPLRLITEPRRECFGWRCDACQRIMGFSCLAKP